MVAVYSVSDATVSLLHCLLLAVLYVASLYVIKSPYPRDHPKTIKQRIVGVMIVCIIGPIYIYWYGNFHASMDNFTFMRLLGLHTDKIFNAFVLPLCLTVILFLGPVALQLDTEGFSNIKEEIFTLEHFSDWKWYRTFIVAPFSEELIFRACMLPLLTPQFGLTKSIFMAPLLFGIAHLHHIIEGVRNGQNILPTVLTSCFQMTYTTIFGAYSAFMYLRTGHLIGPVVCHSFCNLMGFPDFEGISYSNYPKVISCLFILGLLLFVLLLFPLTSPVFYNSIYWN